MIYVRNVSIKKITIIFVGTALLVMYNLFSIKGRLNVEEAGKFQPKLKIPLIKVCHLSCVLNSGISTGKLNTQPAKEKGKNPEIHIKRRSEKELLVNGKKLTLLGIFSFNGKYYALFSCDGSLLLASRSDKICEVLEIADIRDFRVNVRSGSKLFEMELFPEEKRE